MTLEFSTIHPLPEEAWFPKPLAAARKALDVTRKTVEAKRAEALAAVEAARSADLTSFKPARVDVLPDLQHELVFRRSLGEFLRDVLAAAGVYKAELSAEVQTAEEAVRTGLVDMGYVEPVGGVVSRGSYIPEWIGRHGHVIASKCKRDEVAAFVERHQQARRENAAAIEALERRLTSMRDAVAA